MKKGDLLVAFLVAENSFAKIKCLGYPRRGTDTDAPTLTIETTLVRSG